MTERADNEEAVKALQRMVAYVQAEARRLGILDVALLLEHASDAVADFALAPVPEKARPSAAERGLRDH